MSMSDGNPVAQTGSGVPRALLEAAFRVFAERGYRATRLEEVAAAAGVSKGAIYYHTEGKQDLLRRAVEDEHRAIFAEIARALEEEGEGVPASVKLRFVLRRVWEHWLEPGWGHGVRLMLGEISLELPELFRTWARVGPVQGWTLLARIVDEGVRRGEFRPEVDPQVAGRMMVSGLMLQATLQAQPGLEGLDPCDPDRIFDSSVELFLRGLTLSNGR